MTNDKYLKLETDKDRIVEVWPFEGAGTVLLRVIATDTGGRVVVGLTNAEAHQIADWIKSNVPEPEKTPLPTKLAAVVKTPDGTLYTRSDDEDPAWLDTTTAGSWWVSDAELIEKGFQVIFEGVDL